MIPARGPVASSRRFSEVPQGFTLPPRLNRTVEKKRFFFKKRTKKLLSSALAWGALAVFQAVCPTVSREARFV
jgi:hypothetical protein